MSDALFWKRFCMQQPRPASATLFCGDDTRELDVPVDVSWVDFGRSIEGFAPDRVELFDENGKPLRAAAAPQRKRGVSIPSALEGDTEAARMHHFANLLAEAYRHSQETAFEKMVEMYQMQLEEKRNTEARLARMERAYLAQVQHNLSSLTDPGEPGGGGGGDLLESLVSSFMGGAARGGAGKVDPVVDAEGEPAEGEPSE